ncbi:ribose-phosphate pyrophosphokinase, putative, partial [Trypanosoma cruzi marinkellei]
FCFLSPSFWFFLPRGRLVRFPSFPTPLRLPRQGLTKPPSARPAAEELFDAADGRGPRPRPPRAAGEGRRPPAWPREGGRHDPGPRTGKTTHARGAAPHERKRKEPTSPSAAARDNSERKAGNTKRERETRAKGRRTPPPPLKTEKGGKSTARSADIKKCKEKRQWRVLLALCGADPDNSHECNSTALLEEDDGVVFLPSQNTNDHALARCRTAPFTHCSLVAVSFLAVSD